jgi:hypothetical protein
VYVNGANERSDRGEVKFMNYIDSAKCVRN